MTGLTAWLLEQIAADEAAARAAFSGQCDPENGWGAEPGVGAGWTITPHVGIIHEEVQARHVEQWNPARALAECAAKRAIIEEITRFLPLCLDPVTPATVVALAMAQPYADRPGWDPAWRVEK